MILVIFIKAVAELGVIPYTHLFIVNLIFSPNSKIAGKGMAGKGNKNKSNKDESSASIGRNEKATLLKLIDKNYIKFTIRLQA